MCLFSFLLFACLQRETTRSKKEERRKTRERMNVATRSRHGRELGFSFVAHHHHHHHRRWRFLLLLLVLSIISTAGSHETRAAHPECPAWSYFGANGPSYWGTLCSYYSTCITGYVLLIHTNIKTNTPLIQKQQETSVSHQYRSRSYGGGHSALSHPIQLLRPE